MPILIAHRGLIDGPNEIKENTHSSIWNALGRGYDVEIDVWYVDSNWYIGHNIPMIKYEDMIPRIGPVANKVWLHCKNLEAIYALSSLEWSGHYFWHQNDDVTITSSGYIWTHFLYNKMTPRSIMLMPELTNSLDTCLDTECYAICSDYVQKIKDQSLR